MGIITEPDWRTGHCAETAAERVTEATGEDLWARLGGCPRSWREAAAIYRRLGVTNLKDAVSAVLGNPCDRKLARRGDIALLPSRHGFHALGIVRGDLVECLGIMQPLAAALCCWHVNEERR